MPEALAAPDVQLDRRADIRYLCESSDLNAHMDAFYAQRWPAQVRDVSTTGIALRSERHLEPGSTIGIELTRQEWDLKYTIPLQVIRAAALSDGRWLLGCAFASPLSEEEVQALL